jgi:hypothetical protein
MTSPSQDVPVMVHDEGVFVPYNDKRKNWRSSSALETGCVIPCAVAVLWSNYPATVWFKR